MRIHIALLSFLLLNTTIIQARSSCKRPAFISSMSQTNSLKILQNIPDIYRNTQALKGLCINQIAFKEGKYVWKMLLVTHPKAPKGPFWFLPHDNEQSAFDAAVYATRKFTINLDLMVSLKV